MATLKTNLIEPEGATTTLIVGESGGDLVIGADSLNANTLKSRTNPTVTSFTTVETTSWTAPAGVTSVEYLVVAGGGAGGGTSGGADGSGGGGGAGGYRAGTLSVVPATSYTVTVGGGGVAGSPGGTNMQGGDSVFSTITSAGGGAGGGVAWPGPDSGVDGGSGGGGVGYYTSAKPGGAGNSPSTSPRQGFPGGENDGSSGPEYAQGAGGGGSGGPGRPGNTAAGTNSSYASGGGGTSNNITGTYVTYAQGGRGAGNAWSGGTAGAANTGDGGDGEGTSNGGSGIVVLKYALPTGTPQTLFQSDGSGSVSSVNSGWGGVQVLLSSQTVTDQTSVAFTSGLDSTYEEYVFEFFDINPTVQQSYFTFQGSTDGGSAYGINITSTAFAARHNETDGDSGLQYEPNWDLAQSTNYQYILNYLGADADECAVGELHLFTPSSTTYVKNWYARCTWTNGDTVPAAVDLNVAGYFNTTSAINAINFKMNTGNFDGTVKLSLIHI